MDSSEEGRTPAAPPQLTAVGEGEGDGREREAGGSCQEETVRARAVGGRCGCSRDGSAFRSS